VASATGPAARARSGSAPSARGNRVLAVGAVALLALGGFNVVRTVAGGLSGSGVVAVGPPPVPPLSAAKALPGMAGAFRAPAAAAQIPAPPLPHAVPTRVTVPRVGINALIIPVGLTRSGMLGVPPLTAALKAAWFDGGPAPGDLGPAVIDAHVDSVDVPGRRAAFYNLGAVRPGDLIEVTRSDHQVAQFAVDSVELVKKSDFPTARVYGPLPYAGLRLITCGGEFRRGEGYLGNVIVYAHLIGHRHR
jgi:hypothetical protein